MTPTLTCFFYFCNCKPISVSFIYLGFSNKKQIECDNVQRVELSLRLSPALKNYHSVITNSLTPRPTNKIKVFVLIRSAYEN